LASALEERLQAGEHGQRGHGGHAQEARDRLGEREGRRVDEVVEAAVLRLREDVGEGLGAVLEDPQHRRRPARRGRPLEHVEVVRVRLESGACRRDALLERQR
jgi:hypothetical protein